MNPLEVSRLNESRRGSKWASAGLGCR